MSSTITLNNLGYPRIGKKRELKRALEGYWSGKIGAGDLLAVGQQIRSENWHLQKRHGIDLIPCNDFSLYDHVLDTACLVGALPAAALNDDQVIDLEAYFLLARGSSAHGRSGQQKPLEMMKWFNTNYHYLVPMVSSETKFAVRSHKPFEEFEEARALGIVTKPVVIGPVTFLRLSQVNDPSLFKAKLTPLLRTYAEIVRRLEDQGAQWIQLDEPIFSLELREHEKVGLKETYDFLARRPARKARTMVATYFGELRSNLGMALALPVDAVHFDLVSGGNEFGPILENCPGEKSISLGILNGRNIWKTNLEDALGFARVAIRHLGRERIMLAPSTTLLHVPISLETEKHLPGEIRQRLAFAEEKLKELVELRERLLATIDDNSWDIPPIRGTGKFAIGGNGSFRRAVPFPKRQELQTARLGLPRLPATTIGSLPQTPEVRSVRQQWRSGKLTDVAYNASLRRWIREAIQKQEDLELDVLVHGEFERTDMVEFFAECLEGFVTTANGWVQSYGSRCVKPPILFGSVERPVPMTVELAVYAQSLTAKPVKGMLTGPITMLEWSFVREDQPWEQTAQEVAQAIRQEVLDLESRGIRIIQIDEAAFREGLPLRPEDQEHYLETAVRLFRLCCGAVNPGTQIHTHMCYSEFKSILPWIAEMDADVISIEASRSNMELLEAFKSYQYPNDIGPGVYDIHSPRVPSPEEMAALLRRALFSIPAERLWVNPDCGLKTRREEEVWPALANMVEAAKRLRRNIAG